MLHRSCCRLSNHRVSGFPTQRRTCASAIRPSVHHEVSWLEAIEVAPHNGGPPQLRTDYDAIILLAGGQTEGGGVPPWAERRLDASHDLQKLQTSQTCPIVCLGGGTPHKPPALTPRGNVIHESTSCADYLLARGASAHTILKESSSYDTVGNAFFSLTIHVVPAGWRRLAVVTSAFHMPRTRTLFRDMYTLAGRSIFDDPDRFHLTFLSVSDDGLFLPDVLAARREKEAASLATWHADTRGLTTFAQLHAWLHATHACYSVTQQAAGDRPRIRDERLLASY